MSSSLFVNSVGSCFSNIRNKEEEVTLEPLTPNAGNMKLMPSAGKHETDAKRGKACNGCQARENMKLMPSAGKYETDTKRRQT